jgi:L-lactate dehydrogenase complex protein LldG
MNSREEILSRIRKALRRSGGGAPLEVREAMRRTLEAHEPGPRPPFDGQRIERFRQRALAMACTVARVEAQENVPAAVAAYLSERGLPLEAVVWPELAGWGWESAGILAESRRPVGEDRVGITGAFCAVAETGTLVMLSGPTTPPAVSLVPETHVAVVPVERIVEALENAWALLRAERGKLPRAVNLISGPSRTADIEQTVTLGAHGPSRVHIILVG